MRIHSNKLSRIHFYDAVVAIPGYRVIAEVTEHGSRSHARAFEVKLTGFGERHTRTKNTGYAAGYREDEKAATWDDWGFFISFLYRIDPDAVWGTVKRPIYENARHFHILTCDRFNFVAGDFPAEPLTKLTRKELRELGQRVLAQIDPDEAVELGRALIYAALRAQSGNFELDNIEDRHALVAQGYGVEFAAKLSRKRLVRYGV